MRKILVTLAIIIAIVAIFAATWIWRGREITLWFDGVGMTTEVKTLEPAFVIYDGTDTAGTFRIDDITLSTTAPDNRPFPIIFHSDGDNNFILTKENKSFSLGKPQRASGAGERQFAPESGEKIALTVRTSSVSWPTPFDFNFMTGTSPSWKRHVYYRLRWQKPDGMKLRVIWRFEQYFYPHNGWASPFMTHEGTTGLIKVDIEK